MSILTTDLRSKRNHIFHTPAHRGVSHFFPDATKMNEIKESLNEQLFLGNINSFTDILNKNLADTLVNQQKPERKPPKMANNEYSKLSGITNFITGVFSIVSSTVFRRHKSTDVCFDSQTAAASWPYSNTGYRNEHSPCDDEVEANSIMSDCKSAAESCEAKLNRIRQLLPPKNSQTQPRRLKKQFIHSDLVEEYFEDALSFEDACYVPGDPFIEYYIPPTFQEQEVCEIESPKVKLESSTEHNPFSSGGHLSTIPEENPKKTQEESNTNSAVLDNELDLDKCNKNHVKNFSEYHDQKFLDGKKTCPETSVKEPVSSKHTVNVPIASKDKRFKNPNRFCSKRTKSNMKQLIEEDTLFAKEIDTDDVSSVENSPSYHSVECSFTRPSDNTLLDYFDEISGRFRTTPEDSNEDSFQIVFNDIPKRMRSVSDCESEDSFIIFEESPDSCYTSNDVFGESDDDSDSDSDTSDSGCGVMKLPQCLSRTLSNLTDYTLYDEVDCVKPLPSFSDLHVKGVKESQSGLLLDEEEKTSRKDLPVKKVRFSPLPPKVHVMHVWQFAARQARAGHWERYALDRERFRRRIVDTSMALSWVLQPQHRTRIMFQRFMPWWNAQKRKELAEKKEMDEAEAARRQAEEEAKENVVIGVIQGDTQKYERNVQVEKLKTNEENKSNAEDKNEFQLHKENKSDARDGYNLQQNLNEENGSGADRYSLPQNEVNKSKTKRAIDLQTNERNKSGATDTNGFQPNEEDKSYTENKHSFVSNDKDYSSQLNKENNSLVNDKIGFLPNDENKYEPKDANSFQLNYENKCDTKNTYTSQRDECYCDFLNGNKDREFTIEETGNVPKENNSPKVKKTGDCKSYRHFKKSEEHFLTNEDKKHMQNQDRKEKRSNVVRDADKRIIKSNGPVKSKKKRNVSPKYYRKLKRVK